MPDPMENHIIVMTQSERPRVYLCKGTSAGLIEAVRSSSGWHSWLFKLKASASQTPNPWKGVILEDAGHVQPSDVYEHHINCFLQNLYSLSTPDQWYAEARAANARIAEFVATNAPSGEQVEVINVGAKETGTSSSGTPNSSPVQADQHTNNVSNPDRSSGPGDNNPDHTRTVTGSLVSEQQQAVSGTGSSADRD